MKKKIILLVLFFLTACGGPGYEPTNGTRVEGMPSNIYRFVDEEAGVVCWRFDSQGGGFSCLPKSSTLLP